MALKPGFEMIARLAKVPVVPVAHDGLWGSVFSFAGKRYIWKSPRLMPTPVAVVFGAPQQPEAATRDWARVALLDLWAEAFEQRPVLQRHIGSR
jgi:acyl-[acyl-carrier-protein]-phospholipid O-acyltransferase/long-chain-fatty-acid--[acyl-carrier-protein] ligase